MELGEDVAVAAYIREISSSNITIDLGMELLSSNEWLKKLVEEVVDSIDTMA
jgi:hypothetical protein